GPPCGTTADLYHSLPRSKRSRRPQCLASTALGPRSVPHIVLQRMSVLLHSHLLCSFFFSTSCICVIVNCALFSTLPTFQPSLLCFVVRRSVALPSGSAQQRKERK